MTNDRLAWIDEGTLEVGFSEFEDPLKFEVTKEFGINENEKILLLGNNASGKTQLLLELRKILELHSEQIKFIELSSEEWMLHRRNEVAGDIGPGNKFISANHKMEVVLSFFNEIREKIDSKPKDEKLVLLIDDIVSKLDDKNAILFAELCNGLNCTVIGTSLLNTHFSGQWKLVTEMFPKKIIIDRFYEDIRRLIIVDSSKNRNMAEYKQIGTIIELQGMNLIRKVRRLEMKFRKTRNNLEDLVSDFSAESGYYGLHDSIIREQQFLQRKLSDLELKLDMEVDEFEKALLIEKIVELNKELSKIHEDLMSHRSILETIDSAEKTDLLEKMQFIKSLEYEFKAIKDEIIHLTKPLKELQELSDREGLTYSKNKEKIIKNLDRNKFITLDVQMKVLSQKLFSSSREFRAKTRARKSVEVLQPKKIHPANPTRVMNWEITPPANGGKFGINSSVSMILSNTNKKNSPDDLRKIALYFSMIFLRTGDNRYSKKTKKVIIVNNIQKLLKYSINTSHDRENTLIILHDQEKYVKKKDLMSTYFGLNPEKFGHADIFIIDCEREIKPSKIRFYLNKFRTSGTSKYGHLMYIEIEQRPSSKNPNPRHAFNIWIENLEKRTTAGQQSQSAGLHKIIKLEYNGRTTVDQRTRKADELVKNMSKNYDEIINKWEDLGIISLIDFINYNDFSCVNSEIISYLNKRIKTYDFEKHKNLFKKVWRIDQENEDSLEEWYNREFIN